MAETSFSKEQEAGVKGAQQFFLKNLKSTLKLIPRCQQRNDFDRFTQWYNGVEILEHGFTAGAQAFMRKMRVWDANCESSLTGRLESLKALEISLQAEAPFDLFSIAAKGMYLNNLGLIKCVGCDYILSKSQHNRNQCQYKVNDKTDFKSLLKFDEDYLACFNSVVVRAQLPKVHLKGYVVNRTGLKANERKPTEEPQNKVEKEETREKGKEEETNQPSPDQKDESGTDLEDEGTDDDVEEFPSSSEGPSDDEDAIENLGKIKELLSNHMAQRLIRIAEKEREISQDCQEAGQRPGGN